MPEVIFSTPKIAKAHVWNIFSPSYSTLYIFLNTISVSDLRDKYCCFDSTRVVLLFKDHKAADTVRRQLGDSSNKIGKTIQPVFTSTKNKDDVETRAERPPQSTSKALGLYSNVACAMQAMSAIPAGTYFNVFLNIRARPELETTSRKTTIWNQWTSKEKCRSQRDCMIYEMLYIRDLRPINNTQSITLIDMVSRKVTFLVTWHISPPYAQECTNAKTNLHICLTMTSDDVDKYNN